MIDKIDARVWDSTRNRPAVPDHDRSGDAHDIVTRAARQGELIPDATAVTIASWWQTSGGSGAAFAELSTTGKGTAEALTRAIDDVLSVDKPGTTDRGALDALAKWVAEHPSRMHVDYPHPPGHLPDCPACESHCWCEDLTHTTPCVYCASNDSEECRVDEDRCRELVTASD